MGLSNTIATIPGIVGNILTGWILHAHNDNWSLVFLVAAGVYALGGAIYVCLASDQDIEAGTEAIVSQEFDPVHEVLVHGVEGEKGGLKPQ